MTDEELKEIQRRGREAEALRSRMNNLVDAQREIADGGTVAILINLDPKKRVLQTSEDGKDFHILAMQSADHDLAGELRKAIRDTLDQRLAALQEQFSQL